MQRVSGGERQSLGVFARSNEKGEAYLPIFPYRSSERYCIERLLDRIEWNEAPLHRSLEPLATFARPRMTHFSHVARRCVQRLLILYGVSRRWTTSGQQPAPTCGVFSVSENQNFAESHLVVCRLSLCAIQLQEHLKFRQTVASRNLRNKLQRHDE